MDEKKLIASLVVFRELYNKNVDIYDIVASFLNALILQNRLVSFTLTDISKSFNTTFEFELPSAVIKTSLQRLDFLTKSTNSYIVSSTELNKNNVIIENKAIIESSHEEIFNKLNEYVENKKRSKLQEVEIKKLHNQFCNYLLDEHRDDEYMEYISSFIVFHQNNEEIRNKIDVIREGVILYSGIKYTNDNCNFSSFENWKNVLNIFLDTEIIFHLMGYNGDIYKEISEDFLHFVREINRKNNQKKIIRLYYFSEVKDEIETFFYKAKSIFRGNENLNPKVTAMVEILNGCSSDSDLQNKKSDLYTFLHKNEIQEFNKDIDITNPRNYKFNIISNDIIEKINTELKIDNAENLLTVLNQISILRGNNKKMNFEEVEYILLTGNSNILSVAFNKSIQNKFKVPLATNLNFMINRLWLKLNKGFTQKEFPSSFGILTKSQIILSAIVNEKIGEKFDELQTKYKNGEITKEQAENRIRDLRVRVKKPEEVREEITDELLDFITIDSIEDYMEKQEYYKGKVKDFDILSEKFKNTEEENIVLKEQLKQSKRDKIVEYKEIIDDYRKNDEKAEKYAEVCLDVIKKIIFIFCLVYFTSIIALILYYGWEKMESFIYISSIPMSIIIATKVLYSKKWLKLENVLESFKLHIKSRKLKKISKYSLNKIEQLKNEIKKLEDEIRVI